MEISQITSTEVEQKIENGETFILKMSASWCGPCKALTEELKKVNNGTPVYDFDVESDVMFSKKMNVRSVPVMKLFKEGKEIHTSVGLKNSMLINSMIVEHIG
jgi:thioredoxin 1